MSSTIVREVERSSLLAQLDGNEPLLREIIELFRGESSELLSSMRHALAHGDPERLERAAHTLKGCLAQFGAASATEAARQLEAMGREARLDDAPEVLALLEREVTHLTQALPHLAERLA